MKLQSGEYVSLGKVESLLKTCSLVENICVYGDPVRIYFGNLAISAYNLLTPFMYRVAHLVTDNLFWTLR